MYELFADTSLSLSLCVCVCTLVYGLYRIRRDLHRTSRVLEMVKKREQMKFENLHLSMAILEKRLQLRDFSGSLVNELSATIPNYRYDEWRVRVYIDLIN